MTQEVEVLAYIAGMLDGEGCISIKRQCYAHSYYGPYFSLTVRIANTNPFVIEFIQEHIGGSLYFYENHTKQHKTMYEVSWCSLKAQEVLKLLLPFLIVKKEPAELGIEFQDLVNNKLGHKRGSLTNIELQAREVLYGKSRELNGG